LPDNGKPENIATAVTDVSERMSTLVREEIELAKAEVATKAASIVRGTVAGAAGAVFGVFAVMMALITAAWAIDAILIAGTGDIWVGFAIVLVFLVLLAIFAFLFAWRKLRVGAPTPTMAIDEAKKIRETVATKADGA
jgi:uncharacterized small protein (DUF1192 family)